MTKSNLNNVDIVEIGGGYGGLCLFIFKLSKIFNITIKSYTIFDISQVCQLQKKYLKIHNIDIKTNILDTKFTLENNSFLISNYAFSEISEGLQKKYIEQVLDKYIEYGFLAWNWRKLYKFISNKVISFTKERPMTGPDNLFVYISPKKI